ncbi:MAG: pantetheine-phosphate adenylyltransferase [Bacteroidaceae bacterium]|nr:pantetheine-phosphate adenylyltransferase [Bacteroidaceae bacterium]MBR5276535.1 pantetheine-phosphate adenylyltransferase [Bacteroidaceae bacterium]
MEKKALFAGTFDPYTRGHHSIVTRALAMFDKVVVAIGRNAAKSTTCSIDERMESIARLYANEPRVEVVTYEGLTTDYAREVGACCLLRGVRSVKDFEYERDLADVNRAISGIETVIMVSEPQYAAISSSVVRELMSYGKDVTEFLP